MYCPRFIYLGVSLCVFVMIATAAFASGVDTAGGVNNLPLNVEGVMGMTLVNRTNSSAGPVYVGIGTSAPYMLFTVHTGTDQNLGVLSGSGWGVPGIALQSYNDAASVSEPLTIQASSLYLQPGGGYVGIGTTTGSSAVLNVNGVVLATGSTIVGGVSYPTVATDDCTPHGAIAYDMSANDTPVYCNANGKWAATSPPAIFCSMVSNGAAVLCVNLTTGHLIGVVKGGGSWSTVTSGTGWFSNPQPAAITCSTASSSVDYMGCTNTATGAVLYSSWNGGSGTNWTAFATAPWTPP